MKKLIVVITSIISALSIVAPAYATDLSSHNHDYQYVETVEPTCTEDDYDLYRCSVCDQEEKKSDSVPATDHIEVKKHTTGHVERHTTVRVVRYPTVHVEKKTTVLEEKQTTVRVVTPTTVRVVKYTIQVEKQTTVRVVTYPTVHLEKQTTVHVERHTEDVENSETED